MWIRLRIDLSWRDLAVGLFHCLIPSSQLFWQQELEAEWSDNTGDSLATLSVRSALDLLLTELNLPAGSEVLMSAVTVPDMPGIVREHGLVPVPVDVSKHGGQIDLNSLQQAISPRTRLLIVAHLFGAISDLKEVSALTSPHGIRIVEDCAQAWFHPDWRGSCEADISLFSFGTIKTATALGGGLCRVTDPELLQGMQQRQREYPIQSRWKYLKKLLKTGLLKLCATRFLAGILMSICTGLRVDPDEWMGRMTRGFAEGELLSQLRVRPCAPLLALLKRRMTTYPLQRIERRRENGLLLQAELATKFEGEMHSFWLFPRLTCRPLELKTWLRRQGFDSTQRGRLQVVEADAGQQCPQAELLLKNSLFLPCYTEMPRNEILRLSQLVTSFDTAAAQEGPS